MTDKEFLEAQHYTLELEIKELQINHRIVIAVYNEAIKAKQKLLKEIETQLYGESDDA